MRTARVAAPLVALTSVVWIPAAFVSAAGNPVAPVPAVGGLGASAPPERRARAVVAEAEMEADRKLPPLPPISASGDVRT